VAVVAAAIAVGLAAQPAAAQRAEEGGSEFRGRVAPTVDAATGKVLNEAIEALNEEKYAEAQAAIGTLRLERLSPYERSKVEQVLYSVSYAQEHYDEAREHLEKAIDAGGLNEQEISQVRYQNAQLYMAQERWKDGAAALEDWIKTNPDANSSAYYLLAIAYYQLQEYDRALLPAQKAVELSAKPQESWLQLLLALYVEKAQYRKAVPLLKTLIAMAPQKKTYWTELSGIYGQIDDYADSLATMQLAYGAGLLTDDADLRRLADLLVFNNVPYRGGQILEAAIEKKQVNPDSKLYEKLADCWIAAGELEKAVRPLERGAELASTGDLFVRLGEVQLQRSEWDDAADALDRGMRKGSLKDAANAQMLMGVALYKEKKLANARTWFERAKQSPKHRRTAESYLQAIKAETSL
jgi:tetratricopeptide (TPR) repeat protein